MLFWVGSALPRWVRLEGHIMSTASEPTLKVISERNLAIPTRDGVKLYADVYRPDGARC